MSVRVSGALLGDGSACVGMNPRDDRAAAAASPLLKRRPASIAASAEDLSTVPGSGTLGGATMHQRPPLGGVEGAAARAAAAAASAAALRAVVRFAEHASHRDALIRDGFLVVSRRVASCRVAGGRVASCRVAGGRSRRVASRA
eukprot:gene45156-3090_t